MATGHVRKRVGKHGTASWQVVVEDDCDPITGKRNRKYKTVKGTKKAAEAAMRQMIAEMESGSLCSPSSMKLEQWMWEWLRLYKPNIETTTRTGYTEKIKTYIVPELGHILLKSLKPGHIQAWVNRLRDANGLAPKTIRNAFQNLDAALKQAVILQMIPTNPCTGVVLPKASRFKAEVYDQNEIAQLFAEARGTDMYLPVLLEIALGLRRGELLALRWENVDLDAGIVQIREARVNGEGKAEIKAPKSAAGIRDIRIGSHVIAELKKARAQYHARKLSMGAAFFDSDLVICKENGEAYQPDSMSQKWRRFTIQHGLKPIRFHDLRHTCATAMLEAGVDTKTVQERMGHADASLTMNVYAHRTQAMDQRAANQLDALIFSDAG